MFDKLYEMISEFRFDIFTASLSSALIAVAVSFILNWRMNLRERKWREIISIIEAISAYCSELESIAINYWSKDKRGNDEDQMITMEAKIRTIFYHIAYFQTEFHKKTFTSSDSSQKLWDSLFDRVTEGEFESNERDKDLNRILSITGAIIRFRSFFYENRESGSKEQ